MRWLRTALLFAGGTFLFLAAFRGNRLMWVFGGALFGSCFGLPGLVVGTVAGLIVMAFLGA